MSHVETSAKPRLFASQAPVKFTQRIYHTFPGFDSPFNKNASIFQRSLYLTGEAGECARWKEGILWGQKVRCVCSSLQEKKKPTRGLKTWWVWGIILVGIGTLDRFHSLAVLRSPPYKRLNRRLSVDDTEPVLVCSHKVCPERLFVIGEPLCERPWCFHDG